MTKFETSYIIVKVITKKGGKPQHVFLVDVNNEILEFKTEDEAKNLAELFENNSEAGWMYYVKKI
jgi:hypothetical protein